MNIQLCITEISYIVKYIKIEIYYLNIISQYYCFFYISKQMQPWWAQETSSKNIKNLTDHNLLNVSVTFFSYKPVKAFCITVFFSPL